MRPIVSVKILIIAALKFPPGDILFVNEKSKLTHWSRAVSLVSTGIAVCRINVTSVRRRCFFLNHCFILVPKEGRAVSKTAAVTNQLWTSRRPDHLHLQILICERGTQMSYTIIPCRIYHFICTL